MRKSVRPALALVTAAGLLVSGCGARPAGTAGAQSPASMPGAAAAGRLVAGAPSAATGSELARRFAEDLRKRTRLRPTVAGARVSVPTVAGPIAVYDFSQTPRTGKVAFQAGDARGSFAWRSDGATDEHLTLVLIAVGVKMIWGGASAFQTYYQAHPGNLFNKHDCVKAVINGMISEGLSAVPVAGGFLSRTLWPIAWKWVERWLDENLPWHTADMLNLGWEMTDEVVTTLEQAVAQGEAR